MRLEKNGVFYDFDEISDKAQIDVFIKSGWVHVANNSFENAQPQWDEDKSIDNRFDYYETTDGLRENNPEVPIGKIESMIERARAGYDTNTLLASIKKEHLISYAKDIGIYVSEDETKDHIAQKLFIESV